jgi:adenosylcobyric acid synthase
MNEPFIKKARNLMVQGTASSVGKSLLVTALCRILRQDGYSVAPFKSQNMALNSFITDEGLEMGRAQVVQAQASGIRPSVLMNPILLKPTSDRKSQVIIRGKAHSTMDARDYYEFKAELTGIISDAYRELEKSCEIIVLEGAGSPAEINLKDRDIVNMGMAALVEAPVLLAGDIDRGGVFAALAGTMMLLDDEERGRVRGVIINKFRGDLAILEPGLKMIEGIIRVPVLGVVPYMNINIDDEDSVTERFKRQVPRSEVDIAVLRLPRISNFSDFSVFDTQPDASLRYVAPDEALGEPDMLIIPGSKNTIEDLLVLRECGMEDQVLDLSRRGTPIIGICGGYQMLGTEIRDPHNREGGLASVPGMGLLDVATFFEEEKVTTQVQGEILDSGAPLLSGLGGCRVRGYEIHMGQKILGEGAVPFTRIHRRLDREVDVIDGIADREGTVLGTYMHGIFDSIECVRGILNNLRRMKGLPPRQSGVKSLEEYREQRYDELAAVVREHLSMNMIYEILRDGAPTRS